MSYDAIGWAMPKVIKDVNAKSCLVVLAYHHNKETGLCCPSISTIADEMGVRSLNTVRKAIGALVEMKLLTMSREFGERGEILSTRYNLNLQSEAFKPMKKKKGVAHDVKEVHEVKEGGSSAEGGVVHDMKEGGSRGEVGVVHVVNPNKEIEQGIEQGNRTRNSLPAQAPLDDDQDEQKQNSQEKASRSKRTRLTIEVLPDDWREYCAKVAPEIDPDKAWEDFKDYWQVKAKDPLSADWKRTWQSNVRKLHSGPDWMKGHLMKASVRSFKNAKNITQTAEYRERLQACCRGEGRNEKLADDGVTIIVD